ncbi:MAG: hypothetical protein WA138_00460 [Parvibaculum sp.]
MTNEMTNYIDFIAATRLLAAQGFNKLDIQCILDLTGPQMRNGRPLWPAEQIERLAARAYWLGEHEVAVSLPAAA